MWQQHLDYAACCRTLYWIQRSSILCLDWLKGSFYALNHTTLGRVLSLFLSPNMDCCVLCLYFDEKTMVSMNDQVDPIFNLLRGVRQGCPISPSFFTVALAYISWSFCLVSCKCCRTVQIAIVSQEVWVNLLPSGWLYWEKCPTKSNIIWCCSPVEVICHLPGKLLQWTW